ncbi:MAG: GAF domain-containing protein [Spirochaetaceae bacterium]|nr:MAG: GAF domain-containing protein [Spirochaetaceae bacterium]
MKKKTLPIEKLWLPLGPIWASSLVFLVLVLLHGSVSPVLSVVVVVCVGGLSLGQGLLIAFDLPRIKRIKRRARALEAVYEVIHKAGASLDLQEVLDAVTGVTIQVTGVRGCSIKLWDTDSGTMRVRSMAGITREATDLSIDVAENLYHRSLMEGNAVLVEDALEKDFPEVDDRTESLICVPLRRENKVLGALCVYGERGRSLSHEQISLFSTLGDLISLSIANASVYENLKRLDQAKTWFLLKASHELRSPLSSIQSIVRTLTQGFLGDLQEAQKEMLERIELRAQALSNSIGDLLVLAKGRAELSTSELEKINLCTLLGENVEFFNSMAEEKDIALQIQCPTNLNSAVVYGRREGLQSIVANLLSNAVKYTPKGGEVNMKLSPEQDKVILEVSDTGIGIPENEQHKLFSEFFRAENAKKLSEIGTGLGLSIVKSTVEQHGGRIDVYSREGEGSTFRVLLNRVGK